MNNLRFRVCRVCLVSSPATELIDIFEESGEIEKKFQEISKIDISQDKNKYAAVICRECLTTVEAASNVREKIQNTELFFFSKLRAKVERENCGLDDVEAEDEGVEQEEAGEVIFIEDSSDQDEHVHELSSDEETDGDLEVRTFDLEAKDDDTAPVTLFSEFTIEECSGLNLNQLKVRVKEVKLGEVGQKFNDKLEVCEDQPRLRSKAHEVVQEPANQKTINKSIRQCSVCLKKFYHDFLLVQHMSTHRTAIDASENVKRPIKCRFEGCEKYFKAKNYLKFHEKVHEKKISKKISTKKSIENHSNIKKKIFKCDKCPKIFYYKPSLTEHVHQSHSKINKPSKVHHKPAVITPKHCKICFKLFSSVQASKVHIERVHEKIRNFACKRCPKKFYSKESLKKHLVTHTSN